MRDVYTAILRAYSGIFFNPSVRFGGILLLLTFLNPNMGIAGLVSVLSAYAFARVVGFRERFLRLDYYIYNPLLVGLALGYLFRIGPLSFPFFILAGVLTFLLTYSLSNFSWYYLRLPVLSLPFVIAVLLLYLASLRFTNLFVLSLYPKPVPTLPFQLPLPVEGFFRSLGAIVFSPYVISGAVIFVSLLAVSRILALLAVLGYTVGVVTQALLVGSLYQAVGDLSAFNYILIAMAVGGVFLIPSPRSYAFALLSVALSVPIVEGVKTFWEAYGLPAFALPFNLTVLLLLYVLLVAGYGYVTLWYRGTPERTLDGYLTYTRRFPYTGREIALPFAGEWTVWQAFDGEWTHRGPWRYAYDFVIADPEGRTFRGDGSRLTDYYAFGKPVLSPVDGVVVEVADGLEDNPPGQADRENNYGNYVLLWDYRGFYVLVAHLKKGSVRVKAGDRVLRGSLLGQCGNSGYSPQPHIHIHVQASPKVGSPTLPFKFVSYVSSGRFLDVGLPEVSERVEPVYPSKALLNRFNLLIDQRMLFKVREKGREYDLACTVKMDSYGYFYLTDGKTRLYFGINNSTFYFYNLTGDASSPLRYFLLAVPKLPLIDRPGLSWGDALPFLSLPPLLRSFYLLLSSFKHDLLSVRTSLHLTPEGKVKGKAALPGGPIEVEASVAPDLFYDLVRFGDVVLERKELGWEGLR